MKKFDVDSAAQSMTVRGDEYNTRQHAFNIGVAYGLVAMVMALCIVVFFKLEIVWLLRLTMLALLIGASTFAYALISYTNEARDIQYESHVQSRPVETYVPQTDPNALRAFFPSPEHKNGLLFTDVQLTEQQKTAIARAALQHGKLTVNYLIGIGIPRDAAERLREELVSHNLLMFNERGETVLTLDGERSFAQIAG